MLLVNQLIKQEYVVEDMYGVLGCMDVKPRPLERQKEGTIEMPLKCRAVEEY